MFKTEFLQQINPGWVEFILSRPAWVQMTVVFLVSWAMAWIVNRYSRAIAVWFDIITCSVPKGVTREEYAKSNRRSTKLETFFWTPLFGVVMAGVYALFIHRGGFANLLTEFHAETLTITTRSHWDVRLFQPLGLQNFIGFFVLSAILLAASLCDIRRRIIPDLVPLAGIAAGIFLATATQTMFVHVTLYAPIDNSNTIAEIGEFSSLTFASPFRAPNWAFGTKLLSACGCWAFFVIAFLIRPIKLQRGFAYGLKLFFLRLVRDRMTYITLFVAAIGAVATVYTLLYCDASRQDALLSSLFGMTFGGLMVWAVRLTGRWMLKMEAIGFGDVTLMMALGTFTGWQAIPVIFFLSPATGLIVGIIMLAFGQRHVPLGPFLCLTTAIWFLCFDFLWEFCFPLYVFGADTVIYILLVCLGLMAVMLWVIQIIKSKWLLSPTQP